MPLVQNALQKVICCSLCKTGPPAGVLEKLPLSLFIRDDLSVLHNEALSGVMVLEFNGLVDRAPVGPAQQVPGLVKSTV